MPFVVAVCDDETEQLEYIRGILEEWSEKQRMDVKVESFCCAEQIAYIEAFGRKSQLFLT